MKNKYFNKNSDQYLLCSLFWISYPGVGVWSNKKAEAVLVNTIGILILISGVTFFLVSKFSKEDPKASVH